MPAPDAKPIDEKPVSARKLRPETQAVAEKARNELNAQIEAAENDLTYWEHGYNQAKEKLNVLLARRDDLEADLA